MANKSLFSQKRTKYSEPTPLMRRVGLASPVDQTMVEYVASRLADESAIRRSRQFPYQTVQAYERADIMNIGGFSDAVFNVISDFLKDDQGRFVAEIESMVL